MLSKYNTKSVWRTSSPGLESVTFRSRGSAATAATYTDYTLHHVQVERISFSEGTMSGVVQTRLKKRLFSIFADDLDDAGAPAPKVGDVIVQTADGSSEWSVQEVGEALFGNEYPCTCQEQP